MMILWSQLRFGGEMILLCDICGSMVFADLPTAKAAHETWHAKIEEQLVEIRQTTAIDSGGGVTIHKEPA